MKQSSYRKPAYLRRAKKSFLLGTKYRTPIEAVEAGIRSLEQWADTLAHERDFETSPATRRAAGLTQSDTAQA